MKDRHKITVLKAKMNMEVEVVRYFSGQPNIKQQSISIVALKVKL